MSTTVVDTKALLEEGVINQKQADAIVDRGRQTMVQLAVNIVLCFGILAATGGLIFWLAKPLPVAVAGFLLGAGGLFALSRDTDNFRFFGNAAALIGAGDQRATLIGAGEARGYLDWCARGGATLIGAHEAGRL